MKNHLRKGIHIDSNMTMSNCITHYLVLNFMLNVSICFYIEFGDLFFFRKNNGAKEANSIKIMFLKLALK